MQLQYNLCRKSHVIVISLKSKIIPYFYFLFIYHLPLKNKKNYSAKKLFSKQKNYTALVIARYPIKNRSLFLSH